MSAEQNLTTTAEGKESTCFVTVGTTKFDALIEAFATNPRVHQALKKLGISRVVLQIGNGTVEPVSANSTAASDFLPMEFFRFSPSIEKHMVCSSNASIYRVKYISQCCTIPCCDYFLFKYLRFLCVTVSLSRNL